MSVQVIFICHRVPSFEVLNALNNISIFKFENFTPGVNVYEFKLNRKKLGFPKSNNLHESLEYSWNIFGRR